MSPSSSPTVTKIFSVTHPRDLLALAQTSKPFRAFLMSRKSLQCWKTARERVEGYPPCPPFLSEPQLANLIYGLICDVRTGVLIGPLKLADKSLSIAAVLS